MSKIYLIVEGDGEVEAAPFLVRHLLQEIFHNYLVEVSGRGISANGNTNIIRTGGLEEFLERLRRKADCSGVLILLDTEDTYCNCPPELAFQLAERTRKLQLAFPVVVVCACCEYESWFLASLHKIRGNYDIDQNATFEGDPEQKCNAKAWLTSQMPSGKIYKEVFHQAKLTALLDIRYLIENVRSFRRLADAVEELIHAIDQQQNTVTPLPKSE